MRDTGEVTGVTRAACKQTLLAHVHHGDGIKTTCDACEGGNGLYWCGNY